MSKFILNIFKNIDRKFNKLSETFYFFGKSTDFVEL